MKTLLLTVILSALVAVLQAQDALPLLSEGKNISGTWYEKAFVSDKKQRPRKAFPLTVTALEEGSMEVECVFVVQGKCIKLSLMMEKTEKSGQYSNNWSTKYMYIYELPVEDHYIFFSEHKFNQDKFYVGVLIGKDPSINLEALEEFKKFAQQKGLLHENILVLEQQERCVSEHDSAVSQNCTSRASSAAIIEQ